MKDSILVFGVGDLQKSIIERCKAKNLYVVGIDPQVEAVSRDMVDAFEIVGGQDFEKTIEVAERYQVKGIITAATDKPLVMMARVAEKLQLPFFSVETAEWSTDKLLMKQKFQEVDIPCAKGFILNSVDEFTNLEVEYPVIVKPRDNSGSRGVIYCNNLKEVEMAVQEALQYTRKGNVLIEEFIDGKEYSVEGIHYNSSTHIIQITEKITTQFPYNVELGHIQPADLSPVQKKEVYSLISRVANALDFTNSASHTEIKINSKGIYVIETSPRLGGDFISSTLVPLSTGINMEDILIDIATNREVSSIRFENKINKSSGIKYLELSEGIIQSIDGIDKLQNLKGLYQWHFSLNPYDQVKKITDSVSRYGYAIFFADNRSDLLLSIEKGITSVEYILNQHIR